MMRFLFCFFIIVISNQSFSADLEITVKALRNNKGQVRLAMFNDPTEFPRGIEIRSLNIKATLGERIAIIKGVKPGTYAIAIHHDENSDKQMDTNFIGMPEEGYGFSNNAKVFFGPPNFGAASFTIDTELKKISINITY